MPALHFTTEAVQLGARAYLVRALHARDRDAAFAIAPPHEAERLLRQAFAASSGVRAALVRMHARQQNASRAAPSSVAREERALAWARGALALHVPGDAAPSDPLRLVVLYRRSPEVAGPFELPLPVLPPARQSIPGDELSFLELELLDDDDEPFAFEPLLVTFPDGEVRRAQLDRAGYVFFSSVPPGQYTIAFPAREADGEIEEGEVLDIELISTEGVPLGGFEYLVTFADGTRASGVLDENGRARLAPVPPGDVEVVFPALDAAEVETEEEVIEDEQGDDNRLDPDDGSPAAPPEDESVDETPGAGVHDNHDAGDGDVETLQPEGRVACRKPASSDAGGSELDPSERVS
jgi:hypothetical protein